MLVSLQNFNSLIIDQPCLYIKTDSFILKLHGTMSQYIMLPKCWYPAQHLILIWSAHQTVLHRKSSLLLQMVSVGCCYYTQFILLSQNNGVTTQNLCGAKPYVICGLLKNQRGMLLKCFAGQIVTILVILQTQPQPLVCWYVKHTCQFQGCQTIQIFNCD